MTNSVSTIFIMRMGRVGTQTKGIGMAPPIRVAATRNMDVPTGITAVTAALGSAKQPVR